jgi:hypothetical protein
MQSRLEVFKTVVYVVGVLATVAVTVYVIISGGESEYHRTLIKVLLP